MKPMHLIIVVITTVFAWSVPVDAAPVRWAVNGHFYDVVDVSIDWNDAKAAAEASMFMGVAGHLATVNAAAENIFLTTTFGPDWLHLHWLGAFQSPGAFEPAGGWSWVTGEPFTFNNWSLPTEPNNSFGTEDAVVFDHGVTAFGKSWNDLTSTNIARGYIVEFPVTSPPLPVVDIQVGECLGSVIPAVFRIQDAVDMAAPGDTIGVCPGTYQELVTVPAGKTAIALTGLGLVILERPDLPSGNGISVLADDVRIERFEIRGFDPLGVAVAANGAQIQNNNIHTNDFGIGLSGHGHRVRNNIIRASTVGLVMNSINGAEISGNRVSSGGVAILASNVDQTSPGTVIHHNLVSGALDEGISVTGAGGGTIRNNTIRRTLVGIHISGTTSVTIMHNAVRGNGVGIAVHDSTNCAVGFNSVAFNNASGINLSAIEGCLIERNYATRNNPPDCGWDGLGANTFSRNACATEDPPGAWD